MAILQQQRHQQQGGAAAAVGANSKLSPSHLGAGLSKQPMVDPLQHSGMGALSDLHAKNQGMYSGEFVGTFTALQRRACSLILRTLSLCTPPLFPGLAPGSNLSELELSPMMGVLKDTGGQQSRFKWMMEGHSPAPSPPDTTLHKNGALTDGSSNYFFAFFLIFLGKHHLQAAYNLVQNTLALAYFWVFK